jgi:hypothetical protein
METEEQQKRGMPLGAKVFIGVLILVFILVGLEMVVTTMFIDKFAPAARHSH